MLRTAHGRGTQRFVAEHEQEIKLHQAAKEAFGTWYTKDTEGKKRFKLSMTS